MESTRFSASTIHLDHITTALNCLTPFGSKDDVLIYIDNDGLSFVREYNHVIRIQLLLSNELFTSYSYEYSAQGEESQSNEEEEEEEDCMKLCVKINHLLDSINIVNKNNDDVVECTMTYDGHGSPFVLIFEDSFIEEKVEYSTFLSNELNNENHGLQLQRDSIKFECIIKGDVLYNALKDLKEINCTECYIYVRTNEANNIFALIAKSDIGYSKIILPNNKAIIEKIEVYETTNDEPITPVDNVTAIGYFDFNSFDKIRLGTKIASKVLIRMDTNDLLSVNILSQTDDIIVSNTKNKRINTPNQTTSNAGGQLPRDYPGIVIEILMFAKGPLSNSSRQYIELLMDTSTSKIAQNSTSSVLFDHANKESIRHNNNNNLLQLTSTDHENDNHNDKQHSTDNDDSVNQFSTNEIPLFF